MEAILSNKYFIGISAAIGSILLTILAQYILNRRSKFRYFVWHNRIGMSTDDTVFGSIQVTWNENPIKDLYLSSIELINESIRDFENIVVRVFSNDTHLLSESTEIVGSTHILKWSDDYTKRLLVKPNLQPKTEQIELYSRQREYLIPTMNRGQVIRFSFLNSAQYQKQPSIWIDILHKGVKLEFRISHSKVFGVSQPLAALVGLLIGIFVVVLINFNINSIWLATSITFIYGLIAQIPGAFTVRICHKLKQMFSG